LIKTTNGGGVHGGKRQPAKRNNTTVNLVSVLRQKKRKAAQFVGKARKNTKGEKERDVLQKARSRRVGG